MPEIRTDKITGNKVIIASDRSKRPHNFKGKSTDVSDNNAECPFCPGNESETPPDIATVFKGKKVNLSSSKWDIRVVPNKFAAVKDEIEVVEKESFYTKRPGVGKAEVVISSNKHKLRFSQYSLEHIKQLLKILQQRYKALQGDARFEYIQIFKNVGDKGGASLAHPHWQIIAITELPSLVKAELKGASKYYQKEQSCLFCDIIAYEREAEKRLIAENDSFVALAPYAARYPYESWILPKRHQSSFEQLEAELMGDLACLLQGLLLRLENLLDFFDYNLVLHTIPIKLGSKLEYHWHIEIIPRLSTRAGFELGTGQFINIIAPEKAATKLKKDFYSAE